MSSSEDHDERDSGDNHRDDDEASNEAGKDNSQDTQKPEPSQAVNSQSEWQAIWSPQHNAYYFFNSTTNETTWVNPLQQQSETTSSTPSDPSSSASPQPEAGPSSSTPYSALQAAAEAAGIDPSLAYLDPSLATSTSTSSHPNAFTYSAKFNARTGAFAKPDSRDPTHLSEYERAKRMSEFYFDVGAWERDVEARKRAEEVEEAEGTGRKRKKPTKKDLVSVSFSVGCLDVGADRRCRIGSKSRKN
jgi:hypothetical protein